MIDELASGPPKDRHAVVAAAWLHDVGYSADIAVTGLHPLDGARFLQDRGCLPLVVSLVAYHTGAEVEAEERGLLEELARAGLPHVHPVRSVRSITVGVKPCRRKQYASVGPATLAPETRTSRLAGSIGAFVR
jgi:hypothetical protein